MASIGVAVGAAAVALSACSSSNDSSSGADAAVDQSAADSPPQPSLDASTTEVSSRDAGVNDESSNDGVAKDDASEASTPDGTSLDAATSDAGDAARGADGAAEGGSADGSADGGAEGDAEGGATCVPFDSGSLDDAAVAAGQTLVDSLRPIACHMCHGPDFSGGLLVKGAYTKNLTPDPATGIGCWSDSELVTAILTGVTTTPGEVLCVMPKWGMASSNVSTPLNATQAQQIVQFLRTLPPVSKVVPETNCSALGFGDGGVGDGGAGEGGAPDAQAQDAAGE